MSSFLSNFGRGGAKHAPRGGPPVNKRSPSPASASFPDNSQSNAGPPVTPGGKPYYLCSPFVDAALVKGNYKTIVMLPKYVDVMEWVAKNIFDFYQNLNLFYGIISECCTSASCPTMAAGPGLNYTWYNPDRKAVQLPAPTYIDYVMTWVENMLADPNTFPTKAGADFPQNFPATVKHVYRQLLRVFAHIYYAHYTQILHLRSEPHLNSLFAHFLAFGKEYELLDNKDVKGQPQVGIGLLVERWKEMGILEDK